MRIPRLIPTSILALALASTATPVIAATSLYIVQAPTSAAARASVLRVHGVLQSDLSIIHAVAARLDPQQAARLRATAGVRLFEDRRAARATGSLLGGLTTTLSTTTNSLDQTLATNSLTSTVTSTTLSLTTTVTGNSLTSTVTAPLVSTLSAGTSTQDGQGVAALTLTYQTNYPMLVGADTLQQAGVTGKGITIAILDSGLWQDTFQNYGSRILATRDVTNGGSGPVAGDPYGHGTHVTSIVAGGAQNIAGQYLGIAPKANLVIVRALDSDGAGSYSDIIAGINWIVANRLKYNIRVLNLSLGATPQSYYWNDPLDQAVMAAWRAGIVVVAAAGNDGPSPMTIDVPGNVPYVITAGALTDNYQPYNTSDWRLASFSSTGPTYEGFVKPEMVAPGGHMVASMASGSYLANIDPNSMDVVEQMFTMSGTSQAAAVTSGVVALMLQEDPSLTPDNVKCRLMASARPAVKSSGTLAYSVFQQGAGLINAVAAVNSSAVGCANVGLNIAADLAGTEHFGGPANRDASGNYYIMNMQSSTPDTAQPGDGFTWSSAYPGTQGYAWSGGYPWSQGFVWTRAYAWSNNFAWARNYAWARNFAWARTVPWWNTSQAPAPTAPAPIVPWVPNQ